MLGHRSIERNHRRRVNDRLGGSGRLDGGESRAGSARRRRADGPATHAPQTRGEVEQDVLVGDDVLRQVGGHVVAVDLDEDAHVAVAPENFRGRCAAGE